MPTWTAIARGRVAIQASSFVMFIAGRVGSESRYRSVRKKARLREYNYRILPLLDTVKKLSSRRYK
jgi:hypothetical protein